MVKSVTTRVTVSRRSTVRARAPARNSSRNGDDEARAAVSHPRAGDPLDPDENLAVGADRWPGRASDHLPRVTLAGRGSGLSPEVNVPATDRPPQARPGSRSSRGAEDLGVGKSQPPATGRAHPFPGATLACCARRVVSATGSRARGWPGSVCGSQGGPGRSPRPGDGGKSSIVVQVARLAMAVVLEPERVHHLRRNPTNGAEDVPEQHRDPVARPRKQASTTASGPIASRLASARQALILATSCGGASSKEHHRSARRPAGRTP